MAQLYGGFQQQMQVPGAAFSYFNAPGQQQMQQQQQQQGRRPRGGGRQQPPRGGGGRQGGYHGNAAHRQLVERIKQGQRLSPAFKEAWLAHVKQNDPSDNRDPGRHDMAFLQHALVVLQPQLQGLPLSAPNSSDAPAPAGGGAGVDAEHQRLIDRVKQGQRQNPAWKQGWVAWCTNHNGKRDPAAHSAEELQAALAELGDPGEGVAAAAADLTALQTPQQQQLAARVRSLQKASPAFKEGWLGYVKQNDPAGNRDPTRHGAQFLHNALSTLAVTVRTEEVQEKITAAQISGGGPAVGTPEQAELAAKVKALQRSDAGFRDGWCQFVAAHGAGNRDPSRHDGGFLQSALDALAK